MQVKQCRCGGAMVEVPGYYPGPVHCGGPGCGEPAVVTVYRGLRAAASKWTIDACLTLTRRTCTRLPNPHANYECSNPVECPNLPVAPRKPKPEVSEAQSTFSKEEVEEEREKMRAEKAEAELSRVRAEREQARVDLDIARQIASEAGTHKARVADLEKLLRLVDSKPGVCPVCLVNMGIGLPHGAMCNLGRVLIASPSVSEPQEPKK